MSQKYNLSSDTSLTLDMSQKYIYKAEKHLKCYKNGKRTVLGWRSRNFFKQDLPKSWFTQILSR